MVQLSDYRMIFTFKFSQLYFVTRKKIVARKTDNTKYPVRYSGDNRVKFRQNDTKVDGDLHKIPDNQYDKGQ